LDLSQVEPEKIQAREKQREGEGVKCEETGEVIEAQERENVNVEEHIMKVKDKNETLKKTMVYLCKKIESQNKLINNLSMRIS